MTWHKMCLPLRGKTKQNSFVKRETIIHAQVQTLPRGEQGDSDVRKAVSALSVLIKSDKEGSECTQCSDKV